MSGKNLVLELWSKILSANQVVVYVDHQYLSNELSYFLDFLHGENHQ